MLNDIDLSRADLNLLVLFEAVIAERHVGRTAERLHLTPSAVSHGLGRLRRLFNDPLFLRTPKGVVPTARAEELLTPIEEILARVRHVVSTAQPFDPATSTRRFTIGAPDGVFAVLLPPLLDGLRKAAPGIDISLRQLLPIPEEMATDRAWRLGFAELESRKLDIAIIPTNHIPARFHSVTLYTEDFVIAVRRGHRFAASPSLEQYCGMEHVVVSLAGDPHGFIDLRLAAEGRTKRVALTVPNFMSALGIVAETDLVTALPRRFASKYAHALGVVSVEPPLELESFKLNAIASRAAMMDQGLAWLFKLLTACGE